MTNKKTVDALSLASVLKDMIDKISSCLVEFNKIQRYKTELQDECRAFASLGYKNQYCFSRMIEFNALVVENGDSLRERVNKISDLVDEMESFYKLIYINQDCFAVRQMRELYYQLWLINPETFKDDCYNIEGLIKKIIGDFKDD